MRSEQLAGDSGSTRPDRQTSTGSDGTSAPSHAGVGHPQRDSEPDDSDALVELLGDEYTRDILTALSAEPASAAALVDRLEMSRATVYRRLDRLREHGLVVTDTAVSTDGNNYDVFAAALSSLTVELSGGVPTVSVVREDDTDDHSPPTAHASAD
jgi:DNA-binding transcriptional ArsR family regulator